MFKTNLPIALPARAVYYIMTGEQYLKFLQNDLIAYGWGDGTNLFNIIKDDVNWALSLKIVPFNINTTKSYFTSTNTIHLADNTLTDPKEVVYLCSANNSNTPTVTFKFFSSELEDILTNSFIDYNNFSEYLLYLPFFGYTTLAYESIVNSNSITIDYFLIIAHVNLCVTSKYLIKLAALIVFMRTVKT